MVLRDGARVRLRAIRPEDQDRLVTFYGRLSQHTAYQRFFSVMRRLPPDWAHLLPNVDYRRRPPPLPDLRPSAAPALTAAPPSHPPHHAAPPHTTPPTP